MRIKYILVIIKALDNEKQITGQRKEYIALYAE